MFRAYVYHQIAIQILSFPIFYEHNIHNIFVEALYAKDVGQNEKKDYFMWGM